MRAHSLFRSQHTTVTKSSPPAAESQRDLSQLTLLEPIVRGASAESWERARRWSSSD